MAIALSSTVVVLTLVLLTLGRLKAKLNDVHYLVSLEYGLQRAGYKLNDFFVDEAAGNPSLQLFHLKVLRLCRPKAILELGSGQTTKTLSAYAQENPSAYVLTLEQDKSWVQRLQPQILHEYRHNELEQSDFTCQSDSTASVIATNTATPALRGFHNA